MLNIIKPDTKDFKYQGVLLFQCHRSRLLCFIFQWVAGMRVIFPVSVPILTCIQPENVYRLKTVHLLALTYV